MAEFDPSTAKLVEEPEFDVSSAKLVEEPENLKVNELEFDASSAKLVDIDANNEPSTDEGWAKELGEGILEGALKIPFGIAELGLEVTDYVNDTKNSRQFSLWSNKWMKDQGIDPEGLTGQIASGVTQFAIPGLGAFGLVSKFSKLGKLAKSRTLSKSDSFVGPKLVAATKSQKVALAAQQAVAAGVADAMVTTDGTQTIGDFFDGGFTGTDVYNVADTGTEDAARRIGNRFSMLVEGGLLAGAIPPALAGLGKTLNVAGKGLVKVGSSEMTGVPQAARTVKAGLDKVNQYLDELDELDYNRGGTDSTGADIDPSTFQNFAIKVVGALRSRGHLLGYKKNVEEVENVQKITAVDKKTGEEVFFNGESMRFNSRSEMDANIIELAKTEARQFDEYKQIEKDRSNNSYDEVADSELIDAQEEIIRGHINTRLQSVEPDAFSMQQGVAGSGQGIDIAKIFSLSGPAAEAGFKVAQKQYQNLETAIDRILAKEEYVDQSKLQKEKILNSLYDYFVGNTIVSYDNLIKEIGIPKELLPAIKNMVNVKNNLAKKVLNSGALKTLLTEEQMIKQKPKNFSIGKIPKKAPYGYKMNKTTADAAGMSADDLKQYNNNWISRYTDDQWVEVKKKQGVPTRSEIERSIEDSIIKPDGSHKKGFFVSRYRIFEDNKYKLDDERKESIMNMFGLSNKTDTGIVDGYVGKDMFDAKTMENMYIHIDKIFKPRLDILKEKQKIAKATQQPFSKTDLDDIELLTYNAKGALPNKAQVNRYIEMVYGQTTKKRKIIRDMSSKVLYRTAMQKIPTTIFNKKQIDIPSLKAIYGEVKNLKESYVSTVTKMSEFDAIDNFYTQFRKVVDDDIMKNGENSIYKNTNNMKDRDIEEFMKSDRGRNTHILGKTSLSGRLDAISESETPFGAMHGISVPDSMWKSMSQHVVNDTNAIGHLGRTLYGGFLWTKGFSQYSKTILSPITHVRNITSASLFALAQGNIGRGANLGESLRYVLNDLAGKTTDEQLDFLADLQRRGIIGSQAELRELQANLRRGVGYEPDNFRRASDESIPDDTLPKVDPSLRSSLNDKNMVFNLSKGIGKKGNKFLKNMEDAYKGEDDLWKIYNYQFEVNKLKNARANYLGRATTPEEAKAFAERFDNIHLDGKSLEDYAGDNVRNLVPNYDLTSDVIKSFRKLPVGNFVSFPAEIIRTGFNTLESAIKELSSEIPEIREIGMRRMMGALTTFIALPVAIKEIGMSLTGTSEAEMKAVQELVAPFQRNSTLVPVGRDKNGHLEIYDYSHTNPYDTLIAPFTALSRSLDKSGRLDKGGIQTVMNAAEASFVQMFEPFFDESIITSKILDVLPKGVLGGRGGNTISGARIYKTGEGGDNMGSRYQKGFIHLLEGMTPGASPFRVPVGAEIDEIEMGRFLRGITDPLFGTSKEPTTGREYSFGSEFVRATLGVNTQSLDWDRLGGFKAQEFKGNRSTAATLFNRVNRRFVVSSDDYIDAWKKANDARLRTFRLGRKDFMNLIAIGATEDQVIERWKKEGVGNKEIFSIINNQYIPFFPSRDAFLEAEEKGHIMPDAELEALYYEYEGIPIEDKEVEEVEQSNVLSDERLKNNEPFVPVAPVAPVKTSQVSPVARDMNTRLATLLNPNDRIIAQRQGKTV